jgi:hypothetical protein
MAISKIVTNSVDSGVTLTSPVMNTITSAAATNLTLQSAGTTAVTIDTSQNVGIGTTSPTVKLQITAPVVNNAVSVAQIVTNAGTGNAGSGIGLGYGYYAQLAGVYDNTGSAFTVSTSALNVAAAERMRIDSSGNLLVGTTSVITGGKVSISGYDGAASQSGLVLKPSTATLTNYLIFYNSAGGLTGYINQTGTLTVSYGTSSDYRLKENVQPIPNALDRVLSLKPVIYSWKNTEGELGEGFLAHELQEVCPLAVTGTKNALNADGSIKSQSVDYSKVVALLTAAIQEQQALILALTTRISTLEAK